MKRKRVQLLQTHIERGVPKKTRGCPMYLAMKDAGLKLTAVGSVYYQVYQKGVLKSIKMTERMQDWIKSYDSHFKAAKPSNFMVQVLDEDKG